MEHREAHLEHLEEDQRFLPSVSIDCVIFGFHDNQLKVLLVRFRNTSLWALPGGYIYLSEDMDSAANRILEERTALKGVYLEQFYAFGQRERVDQSVQRAIAEAINKSISSDHWISKRFITVGYYALVDFLKAIPTPDGSSDICDWCSLDALPPLVFDHAVIVQKALEMLRLRLNNNLIGSNLLPETFTMQELQSLYETILGEKLLRTNFHRKMLSLGILERVEKKFSGRAHKAPYLYRFKEQKEERLFLEKVF
ncbi:MAG: NUDIX domain-containing protein [Haliscomenobacteraceae bacterium CHB4]|nr:hypothetical protein [Saprospiraceae bacterium]MCE7925523.1 NUDIX domain-containing protein [Haliscomenobacteraceae bacterium CHB4]